MSIPRSGGTFLPLLIRIFPFLKIFLPNSDEPDPGGENSGNGEVALPSYQVNRLSNRAIIDQETFSAIGLTRDGENVNFPTMIRVPDWIPTSERPHPQAKYYLYFSHHWAGDYIRMAWAKTIYGPYTLYNIVPGQAVFTRGVLDAGPGSRLAIGNGLSLSRHISAPDVRVDHENQRIALFFKSGPQVPTQQRDRFLNYRNYVALSKDGLKFHDKDAALTGDLNKGENIVPIRICNHYTRTFELGGRVYGITNLGQIWGSAKSLKDWSVSQDFDFADEAWTRFGNPLQDFYGWEQDPEIVQEPYFSIGLSTIGIRHPMVHVIDDLHSEIFFSRYNDASGEHISRALMHTPDLEDPLSWFVSEVDDDFMRPETDWEGANFPIEPSAYGGFRAKRELRDPFFFQDADGEAYLLYVGAGELGIGIASLQRPIV